MSAAAPAPVASLRGVGLRYGERAALDGIDLDIPAGGTLAFIGPDGVGKSSLLAILAGARAIQAGSVRVLGGDMASRAHREAVGPRIAYMPQGLGRNLYPTLSVRENVEFFARLFGHGPAEREARIARLLEATSLARFADRPAAKLSGGMKQKLGLCCALVHDPDLLVLDEPTTGVDPLSRRQFWRLVDSIRAARPGMTVIVATAYMEEAARFDALVAMDAGRVLATGRPAELLARTGAATLDAAFIALLPEARRADWRPVEAEPRAALPDGEPAIEAEGLTMRFGDFTAVDGVSFRIARGEVFGFIGSNGCGKTTTMKMLTGLLPASAGRARLFGRPADARDVESRRRVGYMTQGFSLYGELTVRQNLELHARLFGLPPSRIPARVAEMVERFGLSASVDALPAALPLGLRQRLSLAVAMIHGPEMLILDEPTSGVDPVARDAFWRLLLELARRDGVTVFISTHFMNEAERCDRVSLMHAGRVLATGAPGRIAADLGVRTLEEAFIRHLEASEGTAGADSVPAAPVAAAAPAAPRRAFDPRRLAAYAWREALELRRDYLRQALAVLGSAILMLVLGYGITLDVEDLAFAVLDQDRTALSRDYVLNLSGSRYFVEKPPIRDEADIERRLRAGEIGLALEIPPGFARDVERGTPVQLAAWIDGAMPQRGETLRGYVQGMHAHWLATKARAGPAPAAAQGLATVEVRYRYNPDVRSLPAMVPAVMPLLLMMIPAILTALSVVREKELGSIVNLYVTPVTRLEFLVGKQLPYVGLAMANFALLTAMAVFLFDVPVKGSLAALAIATLLYVCASTAFGLLVSTFVRSQVAALFGTAVLSILPAVEFSGMVEPVSSLEGVGAVIGHVFPTTYLLLIARGTFGKGLGFAELAPYFVPLLLAGPVMVAAGVALLRKQER